MYEERLSAADSRRYELEDLVASLEEQLRSQARPPSPGSMARQAASAAEIDNEMLRDQVQHLQKKITTLEDMLEDTQAANEREELAARERVRRYKEREEAVRKELLEGQKEVERVLKAEEKARLRVEEIEEALRENTVALENARAEIETMRNEIAVSGFCQWRSCLRLLMGVANVYSISKASRRLRATRRRSLRSSRRVPAANVPNFKKKSQSSSNSLLRHAQVVATPHSPTNCIHSKRTGRR